MDKNKDVIISIRGHQIDANGNNQDIVELVTAGNYKKRNGAYEISYNESELTGLDGTRTIMSVADGKVTIVRAGSMSSQMIFEKGQKHISCYDTDFGALTVGVNADSIRTELGENGGVVEIGYEVEIDNTVAGYNVIKVNVRESRPIKQ